MRPGHLLLAALLASVSSTSQAAREPFYHLAPRPPADRPAPEGAFRPLPASEPGFDALHYKLSLRMDAADMAARRFRASVELSLRILRDGDSRLELDSAGLRILGVSGGVAPGGSRPLPFAAGDGKLHIELDRPYRAGERLEVKIDYQYRAPAGPDDEAGAYFTKVGGSASRPIFFTHNQPEDLKHWFPANARPTDRASFEAVVDAPAGMTIVSNGRSLGEKPAGGLVRTHWLHLQEIPSYLFVVTAGAFERRSTSWKGVPIDYYAVPEQMGEAASYLRNTPDMMDFLSDATGIPFPYDKYAQVVLPDYVTAGMEHSTATTLDADAIIDPEGGADGSVDNLLAHELAHHWFGNLVSASDWDHLWLSEGFATYFASLYLASRRGAAALQEDLDYWADLFFEEEEKDPRPLVFRYYRDEVEEFLDIRNYAKGAWFLHMLRHEVGDAAFYGSVRKYLARHQGRRAATEQLQAAFEEQTGRQLGWFFDQWLRRPGYPVFRVSWSHDAASGRVRVEARQEQDTAKPGGILGTVPLYRGKVRVDVDGVRHEVALDGLASQAWALPAKRLPKEVRFNSDGAWLAKASAAR